MKIYYTDIRGADEKLAKYPAESGQPGSAFGISLLAAACADFANIPLLPIKRLPHGKPCFENEPNLHFSISHSRTHVMCAISNHPVGADTLDHRPIKAETIARLASDEELSDFTFHQLWALRESFFKLTGEGDLRTLHFSKKPKGIITPRPDVFSRLYTGIDNSSAAVSSYQTDFPEVLIQIPIERLLKT